MSLDFDKWLDGIPVHEEDHVFIPIGRQSAELTRLHNERASLIPEDDAPEGERSMAESYTDARDSLDEQIAAALEQEHPDAPRVRLRALSDEDVTDAGSEVLALRDADGKPLDTNAMNVEVNLRYVSRAVVNPPMGVEQVRQLRKRINRGEWARLIDHVNSLSLAEAEAATLPNS